MRLFLPCAAFCDSLAKTQHIGQRHGQGQCNSGGAATLFQHRSRRRPGRAGGAGQHRRLCPDRRRLRPRPRRPGQPRHERGRAQIAAPVLDLGDHPLSDPGGPGAFPPGAEGQSGSAPGQFGNRGRRQVVHPGRGAAPARLFRGAGIEGEELPPLPPRGPAGQDRRGGQFQGRCRQDLDRGASGDVGGAGRLQGAGGGPGQPGQHDLDLRRHRRR